MRHLWASCFGLEMYARSGPEASSQGESCLFDILLKTAASEALRVGTGSLKKLCAGTIEMILCYLCPCFDVLRTCSAAVEWLRQGRDDKLRRGDS